jgi:hypothetical protein
MSKLHTEYSGGEELSSADIAAKLRAEYKQTEVRRSNFPTEIITLPSRGLLYPEGHPLADGKVEMKYMTAKEEDILTTTSYIKNGVVIDKLLEALIITPFKMDDLYLGDKNAIMVAARILGYGKDYEVEMDDPFSAGNRQKVSIDLTQIGDKEVDWSLFESRKNEFEFTLPKTKRVVTFQLLTHGLESSIKSELKGLTKIVSRTGTEREFTTRLKHLITSVDGDRSQGVINRFVDEELFAMDSRELRAYMNSVSPGLDMKFTFTSEITGDEKEVDIPMDVSFFWPNTRV